jgi:putative peptide zinc metalloprotease protein
MAVPQQALSSARLPPLREEIGIFPGPAALDGSPSWTLHDPTRNRFYRLGWTEFEIISRWDSGTVAALIESLEAETTLQVEPEDVEALARFLSTFDLLRVHGPHVTAALMQKAEKQRETWGRWILHNYLFMRIPLVRPDRFLTETLRYVEWIYSRQFAIAIFSMALVGLYLIARQWDAFVHTFVDLFTMAGAVSFGITLMCLKAVHELGHAYTAKRFGCRVPNMGVAILVLVPVLYTDVNEAWKLTSRSRRLGIGIAGVTAELCCAAIAACLWGFLPDGHTRSAAFLVATTTWVTTIMLNLSPFMRYDGYYVLSDFLETPNLHNRAFALARWWLREVLFGFGDPVPEELPPGRRHFLIGFALVTWAYRFFLFLAIALIVYHFAVKIIGMAMVVVEVGYFLARPIVQEMLTWLQRRAEMRWHRHTVITAGAVFAILLLLVVPWRSAVDAPALLKSRQHIDAFVPDFGARIESVNVYNGETITKGANLLKLVSPDLEYKLISARSQLETLEWQVNARGIDPALLARSQVSEREFQAAVAEYRALLDQKARLEVTSAITGHVVDLTEGLEPGAWLPAKARLLSVVDDGQVNVEAYIDEADLARIAVGDAAVFHAEADDRISVVLRIAEVASASTKVLREPYLASVHGGSIPVRETRNNEYIPDRTIYRVMLVPSKIEGPPMRIIRGTVTVRGRPDSIASRLWRSVLAVIVREAGS